mgnify:CR=1 FL=1
MIQRAVFSVSNDLLRQLLELPNTCRIVLVREFPNNLGLAGMDKDEFDVIVESDDFPVCIDSLPRIRPVFMRRDPVVLTDWGFPK